jgi:hypothetical protein
MDHRHTKSLDGLAELGRRPARPDASTREN